MREGEKERRGNERRREGEKERKLTTQRIIAKDILTL